MGEYRGGAVDRQLQTLFREGSMAGLTDGQLLERFIDRGREPGELAFAALIARHGPMVHRVCRRLLRDPGDADDAFQASFLILARRADAIRRRESVGPWLYGVALKVAACARVATAKRRAHERRAGELRASERVARFGAEGRTDLARAVFEEVGRLPERYRAAVVLCDLEGMTHDQAARQLGCPVGTVKSRQARGRERLKGRMARRGLAPVAGSVAGLLANETAAGMPPGLAHATARAASRFVEGGAAAQQVSAAVTATTLEVLRTMSMIRQATAGGLTLLAAAAAVGVGAAIHAAAADDPPASPPPPKSIARPTRQVLRDAVRAVLVTKDVANRSYALTEIAKAQTRAGDREGARDTAGKAAGAAADVTPAVRYNALAAVAWTRAGAGDREGAAEDLREAGKLAGGIENPSWRVAAWRIVAAAQTDIGAREAAEGTLQAMKGVSYAIPDAYERLAPLADLALARTYAGDVDGALEVVEFACGAEASRKGEFLSRMAEVVAAPAVWHTQPRKTFGPEDIKARRRGLDRIREAVEAIPDVEKRPYAEVAKALARLGDFEQALRVATKHPKSPPPAPAVIDMSCTPHVLCAIGESQGKAGRLDDARRTLREALDRVGELDPRYSMQLYEIASAQAGVGDILGAMKTLDAVDADKRPILLSKVAAFQDKAGDHQGARDTFRVAIREAERCLRNPPTPRETSAAAPQPPTAGDGDKDTVIHDPALRWKDSCLARLAAIRAMAGDFVAAELTLGSITLEDQRRLAARDIARARAGAGDPDGTLAWALTLEPARVQLAALRGLGSGAAGGAPD